MYARRSNGGGRTMDKQNINFDIVDPPKNVYVFIEGSVKKKLASILFPPQIFKVEREIVIFFLECL